jgi:hypothetical protein
MSMHAIILVTAATFGPSALWTANDPFVGKWKLDASRSTIVDAMRVQALGANKYSFNFEGAPTETIVADGTDQPGLPGSSLSVRMENARTLTVIRKQGGRVVVVATWNLAPDGRTLDDAFTSVQPDGSKLTVDYVYKRVSGTFGFAGEWESTTKPLGLKLELEIQPFGGKRLRFVSPGSDNKVTFDGQEHASASVADGVTLSGRRNTMRAMEYAEKHRGKIERTRHFELSVNGRTLTEMIRIEGQTTPDIFVFERE